MPEDIKALVDAVVDPSKTRDLLHPSKWIYKDEVTQRLYEESVAKRAEQLEKDRERKQEFRRANPHYNRWEMMKRRCLNPRHKSYWDYGGRGIKIYSPWIRDFLLFSDWLDSALGPKPSDAHTLDRINNEEGYFPGNLRWATPQQQLENRRESK